MTLHGEVVFTLEEPVSALTSGAYIEVDVSSLFETSDVFWAPEAMNEVLPAGSIEASLLTADEEAVELTFQGGFKKAGDEIWVALHATDGVPTDREFVRITVRSTVRIENAVVQWNNAKL